jgi:hypothetical protein
MSDSARSGARSPAPASEPGLPAASRRRLPPSALWALALALGLVASAGLGEAGLRAAGRGPWTRLRTPPNEPGMHEPDPVLGWRNQPGSYAFPGYAPGSPEVRMSYLSDGSRSTGYRGAGGEPRVALVGDSFVQGWGLSDRSTLAWMLQERYRHLHVLNYGTGGYSTYQTLLLLEQVLAETPRPEWVLYGFILPQETRSVAPPEWLEQLARAAREGIAAVPFADLDREGRLLRHPPQAYPRWPGRERLALVALAQSLWARARAGRRPERARSVALRLLEEMDALCASQGARFVVVFLWVPRAALRAYEGHLERRRIRSVDCRHPVTADLIIPFEGHPNEELNRRWTECLSAKLFAREPDLAGAAR